MKKYLVRVKAKKYCGRNEKKVLFFSNVMTDCFGFLFIVINHLINNITF